ncbi:MAG: ferredoxin [Pseudomonadota bacterium]
MTPAFPDIAAAAASRGLEASALRLAAHEAPAAAPQARVVVLLASGPDLWPAFRAAPEAADGAPDPLDRWSERMARELAGHFGGAVIMPNDGPPWAPFLDWAGRAEPVWPSRLGMSLHARRGLWASWRAALALPGARDLPPPPEPGLRPCDACPAPCLSACPVSAFRETPEGPRYDAEACAAHLARPEGAECRTRGCRARRACPVGADFAHGAEQAAFHIAAFRRAR